MICVIQRVLQAGVSVGGQEISRIGRGIVVLAAVHRTDTSQDVAWTAAKLATLRVFPSEAGNFDLDVKAIGGSILLVSNFTVAADAAKGRRPSLSAAADPQLGTVLFRELLRALEGMDITVASGQFGVDMQVALVNDGPVTFVLDSRE